MKNLYVALVIGGIFAVDNVTAAARYANYSKRIAIEHPFADQYEILVPADQLYLEQADGSVINIPKSTNPAGKRPVTASSLPSITNPTSVSASSSLFAKLPASGRSSMLSDITTLQSDRSTDVSSITLQESSLVTEQSTITPTSQETEITTQRTSKFKKNFARPSTTSSQNLYQIAPHPELWLTNNKQSPIQVIVFLKTPLKTVVYNPKNPESYQSSSQKVVIAPGEQVKVQVPLGCYLDSMQVAYDPIDQSMPVKIDIFQNRKKFTMPKIGQKNLMVGAKPYAHSIVISDRAVQVGQVSATKAQTLLKLDF